MDLASTHVQTQFNGVDKMPLIGCQFVRMNVYIVIGALQHSPYEFNTQDSDGPSQRSFGLKHEVVPTDAERGNSGCAEMGKGFLLLAKHL